MCGGRFQLDTMARRSVRGAAVGVDAAEEDLVGELAGERVDVVG